MSTGKSPKANPTHYPENNAPTCDRWINAARGPDGQLWAAVRSERDGRSHVALLRASGSDEAMQVVLETDPSDEPQRPALTVAANGDVHVAWNTFAENQWRVLHGVLPAGAASSSMTTNVVHQSESLCMPPCVLESDGKLLAAWSAFDGESLRVLVAEHGEQGEWSASAVSDAGLHAFRPVLCQSGDSILIAWDQRRDGRYEIAYRHRVSDGGLTGTSVLSRKGRHRLGAVAVAGRDVDSYLAFQEVEEVCDVDRGILDHAVSVVSGAMRDGQFEWVSSDDDGEPLPVGDLRPGLLAAENESYCGYDGVRRRPQLTVDTKGNVWLCWESRDWSGSERTGAKRAGRLFGRCLSNATSSESAILHDGCLGYAVPPSFDGSTLPVASLPKKVEKEPFILRVDVDPSSAATTPIATGSFQCWSSVGSLPKRDELPTIQKDDGPLNLYWLDLHCHSLHSPDAEGEPDELLHYARDFSGLDGMAIVDNDYYPNKTLADAEWRSQQAMAEIFTDPGRFVVFPAYEYTYHDPELSPDFNHRYVMYPGSGGRLLRRVDSASDSIEKLADELEGEDVMMVAHHCTWKLTGRVCENVEVCSSWRVCIEETDFVHQRLAAGDRFGFIATSDSHRACPGMGGALTGVYASELTPEKVFEALRTRRTIATQGERVFVDCRVNDVFVGEEASIEAPVRVKLNVVTPRPIDCVEVIRDGAVACRFQTQGRDLQTEFVDKECGSGQHYYFVRVKMEGDTSSNVTENSKAVLGAFTVEGKYGSNLANARGPFAWTSPIWVAVKG